MLLAHLDVKTILAILAIMVGTASFLPYFWDIFKGTTKPHIFTWLIWVITQGTAAAGVLYGGGGLIGGGLVFATFLIFLVVLLCFKYGSKNITKGDAVILFFALLAIVVWWQLHNPVLAIFMVAAIDCIGYFPTYRKVLTEPWSENLSTWIFFSVAYVFTIAALKEYNLLTVPYLVACLIANLILVGICSVQRLKIPKPI